MTDSIATLSQENDISIIHLHFYTRSETTNLCCTWVCWVARGVVTCAVWEYIPIWICKSWIKEIIIRFYKFIFEWYLLLGWGEKSHGAASVRKNGFRILQMQWKSERVLVGRQVRSLVEHRRGCRGSSALNRRHIEASQKTPNDHEDIN